VSRISRFCDDLARSLYQESPGSLIGHDSWSQYLRSLLTLQASESGCHNRMAPLLRTCHHDAYVPTQFVFDRHIRPDLRVDLISPNDNPTNRDLCITAKFHA
jgi:hypothetical protein